MTVPKRPPAWALAADFLAFALALTGLFVLLSGDLSFRLLAVRVSVRSAWRPFVWASVILALRNGLAPRPPSFAWLLAPLSALTWRRLRADARAPLAMGEAGLAEPLALTRRERFAKATLL